MFVIKSELLGKVIEFLSGLEVLNINHFLV